MRRRAWNEIQGISQIPEGYQEQLNKKYSALVPTYSHKSICKECTTSISTDIDDIRIYYNDIYKYGGSVYHRDNYCMIPTKVPPMTLKNAAYNLNHDIVVNNIPRVSEYFGLEYDYTFITDNSLVDIVIAAYAGYENKLSNGYCICNDYNSGLEVIPGSGHTYVESPLDNMVSTVPDISDEYAYSWEDQWDMGTFNTGSGGGRNQRPDDSSSDELPDIFFGIVVESSPGNGVLGVQPCRVADNGIPIPYGEVVYVVGPR